MLQKKVITLIVVVLSIFALLNFFNNLGGIKRFFTFPQYQIPSRANLVGRFEPDRRANYLLFNLSEGDEISNLVLATFNSEDQEIKFLSVDPQVYTNLSHGFGFEKLSDSYSKATAKEPLIAVETLTQTVSDTFGLPLDGYFYLKRLELNESNLVRIKKDFVGVLNLWKVVTIKNFLENEVRTNLSLVDLISVYQKLWQIRSDKINFSKLADIYYQEVENTGLRYKALNKEQVDFLVPRLFKDSGLEKEAAKVEIKNGAGKTGLASRASRLVGNLGIEVVAIDNAQLENISRTLVIDYNGKPKTAQRLAFAFDGEVISRPPEEGRRGDIVLVVGFNYYSALNEN